MVLFTFITFLIQHIPDKNFRVVRGYGLFSNRLKGELLPQARILLGQNPQKEYVPQSTWRERRIQENDKDPLICENCFIEMQLVFVCYVPDYKNLQELGISVNKRIPNKQFKPFDDSS